jgi:transposase-like protein
LAIGVRCCGLKEVLGIWIEQTEGAKFWLRVMTELRNRGTHEPPRLFRRPPGLSQAAIGS